VELPTMVATDTVNWFEKLPKTARREAERFLRRVTLRKKKALYYQEDVAIAAYSVVRGEICMVKWRPDATSFLLGKGFPGDWLGLPETVMEGPYLFEAVAGTDCELTMVLASDIPHLMDIEGLCPRLLRELAAGYYPLHDSLENSTPELRIAYHLSRLLARAPGKDPETGSPLLFVTQEELAEATGLSRETVNHRLGMLQKDGVIEVSRGRIVVVRPEVLRGGAP
jgi:CRP-like cAMP-binding protein